MGFLTAFRRAPAAAIVQTKLEHAFHACWYDGNPVAVAHSLVKQLYIGAADQMEGRSNPKPHKTVVAALALAIGVESETENESLHNALLFALNTQLQEIHAAADRLPFHKFDLMMTGRAHAIALKHMQAFDASEAGAVMRELMPANGG